MKTFILSFVAALLVIFGAIHYVTHPSPQRIIQRTLNDPEKIRQIQYDAQQAVMAGQLVESRQRSKELAKAWAVPTPVPKIEIKPLTRLTPMATYAVTEGPATADMQREIDALKASNDRISAANAALAARAEHAEQLADARPPVVVIREPAPATRSTVYVTQEPDPEAAKRAAAHEAAVRAATGVEYEIRGQNWFGSDGSSGRIDAQGRRIILSK